MDLSLHTIPDVRKCHMVDSGAFNEIIIGYVKLAEDYIKELEEPVPLTAVMPVIFDNYTAADALETIRV